MIVEQQLHGYRHGHELLSASTRLPPRDQDLVDRLSDVAGPLGPGERFAPYLTCYPLPSGSHYVMARTWQDLAAPRAGCVRTRSLLVPMAAWRKLEDPAALARAATEAGPTNRAERFELDPMAPTPLPPVEGTGIELLEALFLEERVPIAVFGSTSAEMISLRLLTAVWPSRRQRFTLSTFCNSPRTISRQSFDLVFAPMEARSRFSDWKGRRVDGRKSSAARHRWSAEIVDRVFRAPRPGLLGLDVLGEMAGDEHGTEEALRISLLWEELSRKVDVEPHAALGLLDIANTRTARRANLVEDLGPVVAKAANVAVGTMAPGEAWRFLQVLIAKLQDARLKLSAAKTIRSSTIVLARSHPDAAVEALPILLAEKHDFLLGGLGAGLARVEPFGPVARSLGGLEHGGLLRLLLSSIEIADRVLENDFGLDNALASDLADCAKDDLDAARGRFVRHLFAARHAPVLRPLLDHAGAEELVGEVARLHSANGLGERSLDNVIVERARQAGAIAAVRGAVAVYPPTPAVYAMVRGLVDPTAADVRWILDNPGLVDDLRKALLVDLVDGATKDQLRLMLGDAGLLQKALDVVGEFDRSVAKTLARIVEDVPMEPALFLDLVLRLLPSLKGRRAAELAARGLEAGLGSGAGASRDATIATLLETAGKELNGARALRAGLMAGVPLELASRNLVLFDRSSPIVRNRFLKEPQALADTIVGRHFFDLTQEGSEAAARLLWDSDSVDHRGFLRGAAALLPFVMRDRGRSASAIISAAFPPVYQGLQRDRLPDFLSYVFPFFDWDRCRVARHELADRYLRSEWRPADVALAAARAGDAGRILRQIAKRGGKDAIATIEKQLDAVPEPWRHQVRNAIRDAEANDGSWFGISSDF